MTEKIVTVVAAARFGGDHFGEVMQLLGYKVEGNKVLLGETSYLSSTMLPIVNFEQHYAEPTVLRITLPYPGSSELELCPGMWLVKVGKTFTVMTDADFQNLESVL